MALQEIQVNISVKVPFYLRAYLWCLVTFCLVSGMRPDEKKALRVIERFIKTEVKVI